MIVTCTLRSNDEQDQRLLRRRELALFAEGWTAIRRGSRAAAVEVRDLGVFDLKPRKVNFWAREGGDDNYFAERGGKFD